MFKKLTTWNLVAAVRGAIAGWPGHATAADTAAATKLAGQFSIRSDVFPRLVKVIIGPLVFATVVSGIPGTGGAKAVGRIGGKALLWFLTALLVSLFRAQLCGAELPFATRITMLPVMMVSSEGVACVSRASLVFFAAALSTFDLPEAGLLVILGIDQHLDKGHAATNVIGNSIATAVVTKREGQLGPPEQRRRSGVLVRRASAAARTQVARTRERDPPVRRSRIADLRAGQRVVVMPTPDR